MTRLQQKCIIATAGFHLLLLVILFLGPAFFWRQPEPDNLPMLKVIPTSAVDAALSSGVANPTPPAPEQPQPPPTPVPPTPPVPQPVVTPPEPVQEPVHQEEPKPEETPTPDEQPSPEPSPVPKPPKHTIDVVLTPARSSSHHTDTTARDEARAEREARAEERRRAAALHDLTTSLANGLSGSTEVRMPGAGSASYANYGQIVKSLYYNAWNTPDNASDDNASPKVRVVIARDGTVISAHIIEPSGDAAVDASVQQALDRVTTIQPFPDGATESQRTYTIRFNLKAKRSLE